MPPEFVDSFVTTANNNTHATFMRFPNALHARCDSDSNSNEHSDGHDYHNLAKRIPSSCITTLLKSQETKDGDSNLACELVVRRLYMHNKEACLKAIPRDEIKRLDAPTTVAFQNSNRLTGRALGRIGRFFKNHLGFHILAPVKETSQFIRNNDPHLLKYYIYTDLHQVEYKYCAACPFDVLKYNLLAEMNSPTGKILGLADVQMRPVIYQQIHCDGSQGKLKSFLMV